MMTKITSTLIGLLLSQLCSFNAVMGREPLIPSQAPTAPAPLTKTPINILTIPQLRLAAAEAEVEDLRKRIIQIISEENKDESSRYKRASLIFSDQSDTVYPLSRKKAYEIISRDEYGQILPANKKKGSRHPIACGEGVHFKSSYVHHHKMRKNSLTRKSTLYPLESSDEISAYYFHKLLVGKGVTPSLFCIINVDGGRYFLQASTTIPGQDLADLFPEGSAENIPLETVTASNFFVISLLTCPQDYKENNFIVTPHRELYCIDNDRNKYFPFHSDENDNKEDSLHCSTKNILFLLDKILNTSLHPTTLYNILSVSPYDLLKTWFSKLEKLDEQQKKLLTNHQMSTKEYVEQNVELKFNFSCIQFLYHQLNKLQFLLTKDPFMTHKELFEYMNPLLFLFYHHGKKAYDLEQECFSDIYHANLSLDKITSLLIKQNYQLKNGEYLAQHMARLKRNLPLPCHQKSLPPHRLLSYLVSSRGFKNPFHQHAKSYQGIFPAFSVDKYLSAKDHSLLIVDLQEQFLEAPSIINPHSFFPYQNQIMCLNLCDNQLNAKAIGLLAQQFSSLENLTFLNLSGNSVGDEGMMYLAKEGEKTLPELIFLGLNHTNMTNTSFDNIRGFLSYHTHLETLDLRNNHLTRFPLYHGLLSPPLFGNLTTLIFKGNPICLQQKYEIQEIMISHILQKAIRQQEIGALETLHQFKDGQLLADYLKSLFKYYMPAFSNGKPHPLHFNHIDFTRTNFYAITTFLEILSFVDHHPINTINFYQLSSPHKAAKLFKSLAQNALIPAIQHVNFVDSNIGAIDVYPLTKMLSKMTQLQSFRLHSHSFFPFNFLHIISNLSPTLQKLSLRDNFFFSQHTTASLENSSDEEMKEETIPITKIFPHLEELTISEEALDTPNPLYYIVELLKGAPNLTTLSLPANNLTAQGAKFLLANIPGSSLRDLNLSANDLRASFFSTPELDASFLAHVPFLRHLNLSHNALSDKGVSHILSYLQKNTNLETLKLAGTKLTDRAVNLLSGHFPHWQNLKKLILKHNSISSTGAFTLLDKLSTLPSLTFIDLSYNKIDPEIKQQFLEIFNEKNIKIDLIGNVKPSFEPIRPIIYKGNKSDEH